ncbi:MAG: hypothetical protein D6763_05760 [Alphaproteobacteria bacterium]|nr:MAG: hypothetical protein D6763_05760 [Alphaproteobacteria bacterium]
MLRRLAARPVAVFGVVALIGVGAVLVAKSSLTGWLPMGGFRVERERGLAPFTGLVVDGPFQVIVSEGDHALRLEGPGDLLRYVTVARDGDDVVILFSGDGMAERTVTAIIHGQAIARLRARGAVRLEADGGLAKTLQVSATGAASVVLKGSCEALALHLTQAARAKLDGFDCARVKARMEHAASAVLRARDRLEANVSGVAELRYHGSPRVLVTDTAAEGQVGPIVQ